MIVLFVGITLKNSVIFRIFSKLVVISDFPDQWYCAHSQLCHRHVTFSCWAEALELVQPLEIRTEEIALYL